MPLERNSEQGAAFASPRGSTSLNRDHHHQDRRDSNTRNSRYTTTTTTSMGFGVSAPPPRIRSASVHSRRISYRNTGGTAKTRHEQGPRHERGNSRESFDRFSQSSPILSMSSTGGSGREFYHPHPQQQQQNQQLQQQYRYSSKQHHRHHTVSNIHATNNIYGTNSHGSSSRSGVDQYPSHISLRSVATQSRGDSSDAGSVHSAPQTLQHQQYQQSRYPSSRLVVVEQQEPLSTVKRSNKWKDPIIPSKSKMAAASLPPNYKQVIKSTKRVIDGTCTITCIAILQMFYFQLTPPL
jgi:hypothetical protein